MGHRITAIITQEPIKEKIAKEYDLPTFSHNGYVIVGLDIWHSEFWAEKLSLDNSSAKPIILDCPVTHFFAQELGLKRYAIIQTNYFAGIGEQLATVYQDEQEVLLEKENDINTALKKIGVKTIGSFDEFDSILLDKYRNFDRYFEKYCSMN